MCGIDPGDFSMIFAAACRTDIILAADWFFGKEALSFCSILFKNFTYSLNNNNIFKRLLLKNKLNNVKSIINIYFFDNI